MSIKKLWLSDQLSDFAAYSSYAATREEKSMRIRRMEKILHTAVCSELTDRQKQCIELYYFQKLPVCEIASRLSVRPTTVYKHLNVARSILKKCAKYL